jgi:hypothetical protein
VFRKGWTQVLRKGCKGNNGMNSSNRRNVVLSDMYYHDLLKSMFCFNFQMKNFVQWKTNWRTWLHISAYPSTILTKTSLLLEQLASLGKFW